MIKLNNKNITYVALADSNNSLKAPKEIWYADSSNSIKLVYRRKDALIEGEDYEKYHWLKTELTYGTMMKLPIDSLSFTFERIILSIDAGNTYYFKIGQEHYYTDGSKILQIWNNGTITYVLNENVTFGEPITIESSSAYLTFNSVSVPQPSSSIEYIEFGASSLADNISIKTSSVTEDGTKRYIPCKLLKPVPKWLDANDIRRQVGECGMIDLVSGKFYGNVNSVGTFTVENYYERKEWLQGRNGAYINTNHKLVTIEDRFDIKYRILDDGISGISKEIDLFGYTGKSFPNARNVIFTAFTAGRTFANYCYATNSSGYFLEGLFDGTMQLYADTSNMHLIINGIEQLVVSTNGLTQQQMGDVYLFDVNLDSHGNHPFNGDIAYFKISDASSNIKMNLIPCTLTMDLPASMDANNIARTKGTSGMWDLVSDRFYGNVANSGTFKAVNLAEGVDYEVHQWLKVSVSRNVEMAALPVDSTNLYFKHKHISGINYHYFRTTGDGVDYEYYYESDVSRCAIWDLSTSTLVYRTQDIIEDEIVINCNSSNRYVNGYDIPIYGSTIKQVSIISRNKRGFEGLISPITVDGIERYIPIKLLRSIPLTYDANGIARQAGECGMYDTVNDVFYGNVESSGTFSVSDDN